MRRRGIGSPKPQPAGDDVENHQTRARAAIRWCGQTVERDRGGRRDEGGETCGLANMMFAKLHDA